MTLPGHERDNSAVSVTGLRDRDARQGHKVPSVLVKHVTVVAVREWEARWAIEVAQEWNGTGNARFFT